MSGLINLHHIPHCPGVYLMRDNQGRIIYIGKARDLRKRVASYFRKDLPHPKLTAMLPAVRHIDYIPAASEKDSLLIEQKLIHQVRPIYNVIWRDDKSYPYVKLTLEEDYPRLILTRRKQRDGGLYFGPYPDVNSVRRLLRSLWRNKFFPLRPCRFDLKEADIAAEGGLARARPALYKKVHSCIYLHTGECGAPCVGKISREAYRNIARDAELFFRGRTRPLLEEWARQMKEEAARRNYEKAGELRDRIAAARHISDDVTFREVDETNLGTQTDLTRALTDLKEKLGAPAPILRIEGFDVSNIQGAEPVASMVVFERGKPLKSDYRKFRIRTVRGQDDFAMMRETVYRRYRRVLAEGRKLPGLILVDGGKGQLASALLALEDLGLDRKTRGSFAVCALAKREEEVYLPGRPDPVALPKDSPALHILQAVRDEAHRFAVSFHRLRRDRAALGTAAH